MWILLILISIFLLISVLFYFLKIKKLKVKELEEREDFDTDNEYLKNFLPIYKESGKNFYFFSGPAGTGKSTFIKEFARYLKFKNNTYQITSTTGISVVDFEGGMTIHSFTGMGLNKDADSLDKILNSKQFKTKVKEKLMKIDVLIIDEISMFWYHQFDLLNEILKSARNNEKEFGGIKLLVFGDFLQLPPIVTNEDRNKFNFSKNYTPWVFESKIWEKMDFIYLNLNTHYRQKDRKFIEQLDRLRIGLNINLDYFNSLNCKEKHSLKLRATNKEVIKNNNYELKKNNNKEYEFDAKIYCKDKEFYKVDINELNKKFEKKLLVKVESKIIHLINDLDNGLVNGSTGIVLKIAKDKILIKWDSGFKSEIERKEHKILDKHDNELLCYSQFPIKLAHAMTIHKSQGMTLDYFDIDAINIKQHGQAYVALSRGRDPKKINVKNFSKSTIKTNKRAFGFYRSKNNKFIQLSKGDNNYLDSADLNFLKEKYYKNYNNEKWRDEYWVEKNLIKTGILNKYQYNHFKNEAGVYRITILNKDRKNTFYIGESMNLVQRISYHVSNALDDEEKLKKKQNVTIKIKNAGIENIKFEILTSPEWFIGKYITSKDWELTPERNKRWMIKRFLKQEETNEILKLKNDIDNNLIENRTHGI